MLWSKACSTPSEGVDIRLFTYRSHEEGRRWALGGEGQSPIPGQERAAVTCKAAVGKGRWELKPGPYLEVQTVAVGRAVLP